VQQLAYTVVPTPTDLGTLAAQLPALSAGASLGGTVPGELLTNSNFVNGFTGWTPSSFGSPTIDTAQHKVGSQSARLQGGQVTQAVTLIAGHTYLLQAWVMTNGSVVVDGSMGAGVDINDPSGAITVQKVNGVLATSASFKAAILEVSAATSWTLVQMTFAVATSGSYTIAITDSFGTVPSSYPTETWFSGVSLTDQTGAADVTASQPIVYLPSTQSIVPNGNFPLGTIQGWL